VSKKPLLIGVTGCTGTGKTALGITLCKQLNGEVVSCDSMQVYADMPIATAQPSMEERGGIKHHLMGFLPPGEPYSVARYCEDANNAIADIIAKGKQAVIVGGTGLYYNALTQNLRFAPQDSDTGLREELRAAAEADGGAELLAKIKELDPIAAERLRTGGIARIVRAWERYLVTGLTPSEHDEQSRREESPYEIRTIVLDCRKREELYERLDRRVDQMLASGLWEEAERFLGKQTPTARQAIGHKELFPALRGEISREEAVENLKRATRRYAKRQRTWFAHQTLNPHFIYIDEDYRLPAGITD
jgi:tRNA dimethylallyltransferase